MLLVIGFILLIIALIIAPIIFHLFRVFLRPIIRFFFHSILRRFGLKVLIIPQFDPNVPSKTEYDFFISYSNAKASEARQLAEYLMSRGIKVWFAEYKVYEMDNFHAYILNGLSKSRAIIFFTSADFFKSEWCYFELVEATNTYSNMIKKGLEIRLNDCPAPEKYAQHLQKNITKNSVSSYDVIALSTIKWINNALGKRGFLNASPAKKVKRSVRDKKTRFGVDNEKYSLSLPRWSLIEKRGEKLQHDTISSSPKFEYVTGKIKITGSLVTELSNYNFPTLDGDEDDKLFTAMIKFGGVFFYTQGQPCFGHHLYRREGGKKFIAFTYQIEQLHETGFGHEWARKYVVTLPSLTTGENYEFVFDFFIRSSFDDYCRNIKVMDKVVESLNWSNG